MQSKNRNLLHIPPVVLRSIVWCPTSLDLMRQILDRGGHPRWPVRWLDKLAVWIEPAERFIWFADNSVGWCVRKLYTWQASVRLAIAFHLRLPQMPSPSASYSLLYANQGDLSGKATLRRRCADGTMFWNDESIQNPLVKNEWHLFRFRLTGIAVNEDPPNGYRVGPRICTLGGGPEIEFAYSREDEYEILQWGLVQKQGTKSGDFADY